MTTNAIAVNGVDKVYGRGANAVTALQNIHLEIKDQEFFTLLGPSGCGKTTLLRLIAGFEQPNQGEILLFGEHLEGLEPNQRPVNTVFQNYSLFPHMTISENIGFGLKMQGVDSAQINTTVGEMLELVKMQEYGSRKPNQLSGGQQQRIALARALAPKPKVLLLDEPLSALDLKLRQAMRHELKQLQKETGITFVFVTHDQEEAMSMSDRIAVMSQGKVQQLDAPETIYEMPENRFVANFIGDVNLIEATLTRRHNENLICAAGAMEIIAKPGRSHSTLVDGQNIQLAVRPEKLQITEIGEGAIDAIVLDSMYIGTDRFFTAQCSNDLVLEVRMQNSHLQERPPASGDRVGLSIPPGSAVVLND
ncbi:MAG: polyamine ABC transporter ATP-binding protein [Gammaproteobacteria bacterium]|nr:polyamine ABC transporter ATP-binding protein [Gammaproteobacteria bacterium]